MAGKKPEESKKLIHTETTQKPKKNAESKQQNKTKSAKNTIASRKAAGENWRLANNKENGKNVVATEPDKKDEVTVVATDIVEDCTTSTKESTETEKQTKVKKRNRKSKRAKWASRHVAMDCEMVGIGPQGFDDMLARVSIVNRRGTVLLDNYVKPSVEVVNYRTEVSGIRPSDIVDGEEFKVVQSKVVEILDSKVLVGHGLSKDLQVLKISHPHHKIRDTSAYKPLARLVSKGRTPSLKRLALHVLGEDIQTGEHDSVEDARAAMNIYNSFCETWEDYLQRKKR